jgi:Cu/Ag efflux pump CusA
MCYNDQGEVAGAVVMMLKGENSSAVIKRVKEKIAQISKTLPEGCGHRAVSRPDENGGQRHFTPWKKICWKGR